MERFSRVAIFAGLPFGLIMGLLFAAIWGVPVGLVSGLFAGVMFGRSLAAFAARQHEHFKREASSIGDERVLREGPANHFRGIEAVGGWLYLTERRLLFRPHRLNIQKGDLSVPLEEILDARPSMTAWIIPNGLRVVDASGVQRFVVEDRRAWARDVLQAKSAV